MLRTRPRVVVFVGLLTLAILVTALIAARGKLLGAYFLWRLERNPDIFLEYLAAGADSYKQQALRRHVLSAAGREGLITRYLAAAREAEGNLNLPSNEKYDEWTLFWFSESQWKCWRYTDIPDWSFRGVGCGRTVSSRGLQERLRGLQDLLLGAHIEHLAHPNYPGLDFTLYTHQAEHSGRTAQFLEWQEWAEGHVFVVSGRGVSSPDVILFPAEAPVELNVETAEGRPRSK